jgi:hypothetical protein
MKHLYRTAFMAICLAFFLILLEGMVNHVQAVTMYPQQVRLTYLQGTAYQIRSAQERLALKPNMTFGSGDVIQTSKGCRLELALPDSSLLRFNEDSEFMFKDIYFSASLNQRRVTVLIVKGMLWASIKKSSNKRSRFEIAFQCLQTIVQEATFKMSLSAENLIIAKLYRGEAVVKYPATQSAPALSELCPGGSMTKHRAWSHLLLPMHQVILFPEGQITKPFRFAAKTDFDSWVLWNRKRSQLQDRP